MSCAAKEKKGRGFIAVLAYKCDLVEGNGLQRKMEQAAQMATAWQRITWQPQPQLESSAT
eukprot:1148653-Pelagomonas_calceolata.AAC.2